MHPRVALGRLHGRNHDRGSAARRWRYPIGAVGSGFQRAGTRSLVDGVIRGSAKAPLIVNQTDRCLLGAQYQCRGGNPNRGKRSASPFCASVCPRSGITNIACGARDGGAVVGITD